jgi:hypothetical protein
MSDGLSDLKSDGGSAVSKARTPADIEADIVSRRRELAATLDEIAVRVHPRTIVGDASAKAAAAVDRTAGRAVANVRAQFVDEKGSPRLDRVIPVAVVAVAVVGGLFALSARRRRG